jgi:hypothetical protein
MPNSSGASKLSGILGIVAGTTPYLAIMTNGHNTVIVIAQWILVS